MKQANNHLNHENEATAQQSSLRIRQFLMASLFPLIVLALLLLSLVSNGQNQYRITEIITDFNGYWKSGATNINPVKPDNSHNLLAFTHNGVRFSTGVNDAALSAKGDTYYPGDYRALPVKSVTGAITSNTKIGLGEKYDGVTNGKSNPSPVNNIPLYLTDGLNGLDLGTCVANLPVGQLLFSVNNVKITAINDGVPDVVITQAADPSGNTFDSYEFADINGNRVGNPIDIRLNNIPSVGNWVADFYEASQNPMSLSTGFTKTERGLRLWTGDFSVFGINAGNISQIAYFRINLSGESDVAFVAYNTSALNVDLVLPTKLASFTAKSVAESIVLNWATVSETNTDRFEIEKSLDGASFAKIGAVKAAGISNRRKEYSFDAPKQTGSSFYRLKMIDKDGKFEYSNTVSVNNTTTTSTAVAVYPNPATSYSFVKHPVVTGNETIGVYNNNGMMLAQVKASGNQTRLDVSSFAKGTYHVVFSSSTDRQVCKLVVN